MALSYPHEMSDTKSAFDDMQAIQDNYTLTVKNIAI